MYILLSVDNRLFVLLPITRLGDSILQYRILNGSGRCPTTPDLEICCYSSGFHLGGRVPLDKLLPPLNFKQKFQLKSQIHQQQL